MKPFYMRLNDDGRTVACFDFLVRSRPSNALSLRHPHAQVPGVGELIGGSEREDRYSYVAEL